MQRRMMAATVAAVAVSASSAHAAPAAHWTFDDPAGSTTVVDAIGGSSGTLTGSPVLGAAGMHGGAINLGGGSDGVNVGSAAALMPTDDFSITFWFRPDDLSSFNFQRIIDATGTGGGITAGYRVLLNNAAGGPALRWLVQGTGALQVIDSTALSAGRWYFGAVTYDADGQSTVSVYDRDARTLTSNSTSAVANGAVDYAGGGFDVYLGRSTPGNAFDAHLDDVAIWHSVLGADQIAYVGEVGVSAPIPVLAYNARDAAVNDGVRDEWRPHVGTGWDWNLNNSPDRVDVATPARGITHAYRYSGDEAVAFSNFADSQANAPLSAVVPSNADASFEVWFRLGDSGDSNVLNEGKRTIFESGGFNGVSLTLNDNMLRFGTATGTLNSGTEVQTLFDLATLDAGALADFIQAVGVYDKTSGQTRLYVNGELVQVVNAVTGGWSGANAAGLGASASSTGGFLDNGPDYQPFIGDIAIFNLYDAALTDGQVAAAYIGVAIPEPATAVFGLAAALISTVLGRGNRRTCILRAAACEGRHDERLHPGQARG